MNLVTVSPSSNQNVLQVHVVPHLKAELSNNAILASRINVAFVHTEVQHGVSTVRGNGSRKNFCSCAGKIVNGGAEGKESDEVVLKDRSYYRSENTYSKFYLSMFRLKA